MALNREDEGYSIKGTSEEYDAEEEIDRDIQDYCVTGEEGNYYQIGSYATDGSYAMMQMNRTFPMSMQAVLLTAMLAVVKHRCA